MDARQALKDFLAKADLKPAQFARTIEYDRSNFHRLLNDNAAMPSLPLAVKIEQQTGGAVPASAWAA
jgi:plasmid maintenance system antidote protein VapI